MQWYAKRLMINSLVSALSLSTLQSDHRFESMVPTILNYASMHDAELWITSAKTGLKINYS